MDMQKMRQARRAVLRVALIAPIPAAVLAGRREPQNEGDLKAEVGAAYSAWDQAFRDAASGTSSIEPLVASYLATAQLLPAQSQALWGHEGIRSFFGSWVPNSGLRHELELLNAGGGKGQLVFGTAKWTVWNGETVAASGFATHVFERQGDGRLRLRVHTFNNL